jgi:hypothetical protein
LLGSTNKPATKWHFLSVDSRQPGTCKTSKVLLDIQNILRLEDYEKASSKGSTFHFIKYIQSLENDLWEAHIIEIKQLADLGLPARKYVL